MWQNTGFSAIDGEFSVNRAEANNNHTLNGQDLNNFAPRVGFSVQTVQK